MAAASPTQLQLAQLPTFNLLVLPLSTPSPAFQLQIKTILNTLFGLTLSPDQLSFTTNPNAGPQRTTNDRISFLFRSNPADARRYIEARQGQALEVRVHGAVVFVDADQGDKDVRGLNADGWSFPLETLLVPLCSKPLSPEAQTTLSLSLRRQGLPQKIAHCTPLSLPSLSSLSESFESLFLSSERTSEEKEEEGRLKRLTWSAAQRVSRDEKVGMSVQKGMKLFSLAVGASAQPIPFIGGATGVTAIGLLQADIMLIYNFQDQHHVLKQKAIANIFYEAATGLPAKWLVSLMGLSLVSGLWEAPASARGMMTSIADLTLVLDALFALTLQSPTSPLTSDQVKAVLHRYETGPPKSSLFGGKEKKGGLVESTNVKFSRDLVHRRLGRENISTFNVWKSLQRTQAQTYLEQVIKEHRF